MMNADQDSFSPHLKETNTQSHFLTASGHGSQSLHSGHANNAGSHFQQQVHKATPSDALSPGAIKALDEIKAYFDELHKVATSPSIPSTHPFFSVDYLFQFVPVNSVLFSDSYFTPTQSATGSYLRPSGALANGCLGAPGHQSHGTVVNTSMHYPGGPYNLTRPVNPLSRVLPHAPAPSLQTQQGFRASLPSLSSASESSEPYSPISLLTPADGPTDGNARVLWSQSHQPLYPIAENVEENKVVPQFVMPPVAGLTHPTTLVHEAHRHPSVANEFVAVSKGLSPPKRPAAIPAPVQNNASRTHKSSGNKPKSSRFTSHINPPPQIEKRSTMDSYFPPSAATLGDKFVCQFPAIGNDGVGPVCGEPLTKDANSIRKHFQDHYKDIGYIERRAGLKSAALDAGLSKEETDKIDFRAYCPWCQKEATLFGGLNRHILEKELKLHGVECPCGGTISRGNQKHNNRRHEESKVHKEWVRRSAESQSAKRTLQTTDEEFVEGSSKGTKRSRHS